MKAQLIASTPSDGVPANDSSSVTIVVLPHATAGSVALAPATCTFRTPRSAKGKVVRGSVSFSVDGTAFAKRFSATLR